VISEHAWLERVRRTARLYDWLTYHTFDSRGSEPGFPDLVLARPERVIFAELKVGAGRLTRAQRIWLDTLGRTGHARLWRPDDWPDVLAELRPP
jgi:VRR-NUC domain-containing protein